jgi:hypothetical protein
LWQRAVDTVRQWCASERNISIVAAGARNQMINQKLFDGIVDGAVPYLAMGAGR